MAEHEPSIGATDEWYTPPEIFRALGVTFDLDVASPSEGRAFLSVPAHRFYTPEDDGLAAPWCGFVWMNPPFGGRNGHVPWIRKFIEHGDGIGLVRAYTSSGWWHDWIPLVDAILFPRGKTKFIRADGTVGGSPGHGIALIAMGDFGVRTLAQCGLGMFYTHRYCANNKTAPAHAAFRSDCR